METFIIGVLLAASVIGLTFIVERGLALREGKIIPSAVKGAMETCRTLDDLPMLRRICQQHPSPLSRLLLWPNDIANGPELKTPAHWRRARAMKFPGSNAGWLCWKSSSAWPRCWDWSAPFTD